MKKILSLIIVLTLICSTFILSFAYAEDNLDMQKEEWIKNMQNLKIKHKNGVRLYTKTFSKKEGDNIALYEKKGEDIQAKIDVKDYVLTGYIKTEKEKFNLKGKFDRIEGKFIGNIMNRKDYTFKGFCPSNDMNSMIINVFDPDENPTTYIINGKISTTKKIGTYSQEDLKKSISAQEENTIAPLGGEDYYRPLTAVNSSGIHLSTYGPIDGSYNPYIKALISTDVDDAWDDSYLMGFKVAEYVEKIEFTFIPEDSYTVFKKHQPNGDSDTSINLLIPVNVAGLGWQLLSGNFTTSSTSCREVNGSDVYVRYTYSQSKGHLSEWGEPLEDRLNDGRIHGAEVNLSTTASNPNSYLEFTVDGSIRYHLSTQDSLGFYNDAYPSYDTSVLTFIKNI